MRHHGDRTGNSSRHRRLQIATLAGAVLLVGSVAAEPLPLETREKLLKEQAVEAVTRSDATALYDIMDEYRALERDGGTAPAGLFFAEAEAARANGEPVRAERAFNDYFRVASPEGEAFAEASRVYREFRQSIPEAVWTVLDSMVPVPGRIPATGGEADGGDATAEAATTAGITPFSIGKRVVSRGAFMAFVRATGHAFQPPSGAGSGDCEAVEAAPGESVAGSESDPIACVNWADATAYLNWLNQLSGLKFRLPTAAEWLRAGKAGVAPGPSEWTADCASAPAGEAPADAAEAATATESCTSHAVVDPAGMSEASGSAAEPGVARNDDFRSPSLGFRVAL